LLLITGDQLVIWKLLLVAACTVALLLLVKALSSSERIDTPAAPLYEPPSTQLEANAPQRRRFRSEEAPKAKDLDPLSVTRFNFSQFNAEPGPPDPECFADELLLELYDPVSEHRWQTSFVVATPSGISKLMQEERWAFFYANEIFIVRRYDLRLIQEAVYGRINEIREQVGAERDTAVAG
jgi:hypothetical protein